MSQSNLFRALVVGGAVLAASSCRLPGPKAEKPPKPPEPVTATTEVKPTAETGTKTTQGFCDPKNANMCEDGKPKAGVECCWQTNC